MTRGVPPAPPALARDVLDRAAERRRDEEWLAAAWADGGVLVVDDRRRALTDDTGGLLLVSADEAPDGERYFLGVDPAGRARWAVAAELPRRLGARPVTLRDVGAHLDDADAEAFLTASALANWHTAHGHCSRCGTPTLVEQAGWVRRCPADDSLHFPRTDPAVIVLVHDGGDRCLLGRQAGWPPGRFSTLAGFVEPGETIESAVVREVAEEAGVPVREVSYLASQPWPFPSSLMLGFEALGEAVEPRIADDELEEVGWFTRSDLRDGVVGLPPAVSIAHWLIRGWLDRG